MMCIIGDFCISDLFVLGLLHFVFVLKVLCKQSFKRCNMIWIDIHKMPSKLRIYCHFSLFMSLISAEKYLIDIDSGEDEGNKGIGSYEYGEARLYESIYLLKYNIVHPFPCPNPIVYSLHMDICGGIGSCRGEPLERLQEKREGL